MAGGGRHTDEVCSLSWNGSWKTTTDVPNDFSNMQWLLFSHTFVADSASTTLTIAGDLANGRLGFAVDNVSVSAVPIPPAAYLFCGSILALIGIARGRKSSIERPGESIQFQAAFLPFVRRLYSTRSAISQRANRNPATERGFSPLVPDAYCLIMALSVIGSQKAARSRLDPMPTPPPGLLWAGGLLPGCSQTAASAASEAFIVRQMKSAAPHNGVAPMQVGDRQVNTGNSLSGSATNRALQPVSLSHCQGTDGLLTGRQPSLTPC